MKIAAIPIMGILCSCVTAQDRPQKHAIQGISISGATVAFYEVEGRTAEQIRGQLDSLGPIDETGHPSHAATHWDIRWTWPGYGTPTGEVSRAIVTMRAMTILPKWDPPEETAASVIKQWNKYLEGLAKHEGHHVFLAAQGRDEIASALRNATRENADSIAFACLNECRRRNALFDQESGHGAADGLEFP